MLCPVSPFVLVICPHTCMLLTLIKMLLFLIYLHYCSSDWSRHLYSCHCIAMNVCGLKILSKNSKWLQKETGGVIEIPLIECPISAGHGSRENDCM